jgi:nucleolar protein 56
LVLGICNPTLKNFLELNLPKVKAGKESKVILGVGEDKIGSSIQDAVNAKFVAFSFFSSLVPPYK